MMNSRTDLSSVEDFLISLKKYGVEITKLDSNHGFVEYRLPIRMEYHMLDDNFFIVLPLIISLSPLLLLNDSIVPSSLVRWINQNGLVFASIWLLALIWSFNGPDLTKNFSFMKVKRTIFLLPNGDIDQQKSDIPGGVIKDFSKMFVEFKENQEQLSGKNSRT